MSKEIWKWIPEYKGYYKVSTRGRVKSYHKNKVKLLKPTINGRGYLRVGLMKEDRSKRVWRPIHQLVLETFVCPRPSGKEACHKDDNTSNNCVSNLHWKTHKQNCKEAIRNGKYKNRNCHKGELCHSAKLTKLNVIQIRKSFNKTWSVLLAKCLAKKHKVNYYTIRDIFLYNTWKSV